MRIALRHEWFNRIFDRSESVENFITIQFKKLYTRTQECCFLKKLTFRV